MILVLHSISLTTLQKLKHEIYQKDS